MDQTKILFSSKDATLFYNRIKTYKFDWKILIWNEDTLSLDRIYDCFW